MGDHFEPRELTVDEAVALAMYLQRQGKLVAAGELLARVREAVPDHADAIHYSGVLAHQQGRGEESVALIEKSLTLVPGQADWHSNLGIVLQSLGRLEAAIAAYERAIEIDPGHANAHSNLGVLLRAVGRPNEAEAAYRTAIRLCPAHVDAYHNLGILLNALHRTKEASACFCKVVTLQPRHREARRLLVLAHCSLGEVDEAVKILEDWLHEEPGNPIAVHMLAACTGRDVPRRASTAFVTCTFDSFAESFEAKLASLEYRAPALVAAALADAGLVADHRLNVLDAGCGTGLCGPLLAPYAARLVGVDLSAGMLEHARRKRVYAELEQAELAEFLRGRPAAFDVIVSADTLCYCGDLREFCDVAARALRPSGLLVFTVEHAAGTPVADFRLELHGRYSHDRRYVERTLVEAGLRPEIECADLRMEAGAKVAGLVIRASKPTHETRAATRPTTVTGEP